MSKRDLKVGILGVGQVGSSILSLVSAKYKTFIRDVDKDTIENEKLDVLHICIPYSDDFERIVVDSIIRNKPSLTIIESTVPVKTTENIFKTIKRPIAHCPVRGTHATMVSDLRKFIKFIGAIDIKSAKQASKYYRSLGIKTKILSSARETEMGKLLDTTYYAMCIAWHQEMERFCKKFDVDFEEAVTLFNKTYNQGYKKAKPNVLRPVLTPGFIGGHCLMPNIELLEKSVASSFLADIKESNEKKKKSI